MVDTIADDPWWPTQNVSGKVRLADAPLAGPEADQLAEAVRAQIIADHEVAARGMVSGSLSVANGKVVTPARRDPCGGFLNVSIDVVAAMMSSGCGVWAMFPGPLGTDVMHFDIASGAFGP